jgi:hypothetical protein
MQGSLDRAGGWAALGSAVMALVYTVAFVVTKTALVYSLALMVGSLLTAIALVAVYWRLRDADPGLALLGLALGFAGSMGAFVHGGYDLAVVVRPEEAGTLTGPFPVDPRGLMTFGVSGMGVLVLSWVATRSDAFPRTLGRLGLVLGVLLVVVYLARLIVFDANDLLVLGSAAAAALVSVAWYVWVGRVLLREQRGTA